MKFSSEVVHTDHGIATEPSTDVPGSMMQHQFTVSERIRDLDRLTHARFCDQNVAVQNAVSG